MKKERICLCGMQLGNGYSGGRYHAWILGLALAEGGARVVWWTNSLPGFSKDFSDYPGLENIEVHPDKGYEKEPSGAFSWVIVVPDRGTPLKIYKRWVRLARRKNAKIALLNFETPNWVNLESKFLVDESLWVGWRYVSQFCDLILSSTETANYYSRLYYSSAPKSCRFAACAPAINSRVADQVGYLERENKVLVISRLGGHNFKHKGGEDVLRVIGPEMAGMTLSFLLGVKDIDKELLVALRTQAKKWDVNLRFVEAPSDLEKFAEIKTSRLLLFLSWFEGFGYPPVEALYCGTPCLAYDLPVLREVSGDGVVYVERGDQEGVRQKISLILDHEDRKDLDLKGFVADTATFEHFIVRVQQCFASGSSREKRGDFAWRALRKMHTCVLNTAAEVRRACK